MRPMVVFDLDKVSLTELVVQAGLTVKPPPATPTAIQLETLIVSYHSISACMPDFSLSVLSCHHKRIDRKGVAVCITLSTTLRYLV